MLRILTAFPLAALLFLAAPEASAQIPAPRDVGFVGEVPTNSPNYYYFADAGEIPTRVSVWGTVRAPGTYVVRAGVDLAELLSLAGGPLLTARPDNATRDVTVRVYRLEGNQRILAYEETLVDMIAEPGAYPVLEDEDVVEVETVESRNWTIRDTVTVIGAVATSVIAVDRLISLARSF
jgi:hypothetical protein